MAPWYRIIYYRNSNNIGTSVTEQARTTTKSIFVIARTNGYTEAIYCTWTSSSYGFCSDSTTKTRYWLITNNLKISLLFVVFSFNFPKWVFRPHHVLHLVRPLRRATTRLTLFNGHRPSRWKRSRTKLRPRSTECPFCNSDIVNTKNYNEMALPIPCDDWAAHPKWIWTRWYLITINPNLNM